MTNLKRALRVNFVKIGIIALLAMWILLMYLDPKKLSEESILTGYWYAIGMICIVIGFCMSVFVWLSKIRSAKVVHCQGNDTWDPSEWHEIPAEISDGEIVTPRLLVRGVGGFKAMGVYLAGKGAKGWDVVMDFPGVWYRRGANLVLNTDSRETFIGQHEHEEIYNIIDKLNKYLLGIPGMISIVDDTPIYVYGVPSSDLGISTENLEHFSELSKAERHFSKRLAEEHATNMDLRMKLSALRGVDHGQGTWKQAMRVKGVDANGNESGDREQ